jgi:hypothetical protein
MAQVISTYEIKAEFTSSEGQKFETKNIKSFLVHKNPTQHSSNMTIMDGVFENTMYNAFNKDYRNGLNVVFDITINVVDKNERNGNDYKILTQLIKKKYLILKYEVRDQQSGRVGVRDITCFLEDPVINHLLKFNKVNKIVNNKTALEILEDYEGELKKLGITEFKKIGENIDANKYKYEQALLKAKNDLYLASVITCNYKVVNSIAYYYFDDFILNADNKENIVALFVNLSEKALKLFKKMDPYSENYPEFNSVNRVVNEIPVNDIDDFYDKLEETDTSIRDKKGNVKNEKISQATILSNKEKNKTAAIDQNRKIINKDVQLSSKQDKPSKSLTYYTPDDVENGSTRLKNIFDLLKNKIHSFVEFEISESFPDFIQLDSIYSFNVKKKHQYEFVPIVISHVFYNKSPSDYTLHHGCGYTCLKYNLESK